MFCLKLSGALALLLIVGAAANAQSRSSFWLERCAWNATDIVVATEGKVIDGRMTVLESWSGNLAPGQALVLPELADFRDEKSRSIVGGYYRTETSDRELTLAAKPYAHVSGNRMILFLVKRERASADGHDSLPSFEWKSAGDDGLRFSLMWVETGKTFAFEQIATPGPNLLMQHWWSEDEVKDRAKQVLDARDALTRIRLLPNQEERAQALAPYAAMDVYQVRATALEELQLIGTLSLPVLKQLLHDPTLIQQHDEYISAMAEIGGSGVADELIDLVNEEVVFWQNELRVLKPEGSRFTDDAEFGRIFAHRMRVERAVYALREMTAKASLTAVQRLRDLLRSAPGPDDNDIRSMLRSCDELIFELGLIERSDRP